MLESLIALRHVTQPRLEPLMIESRHVNAGWDVGLNRDD